MNKNQIDRKEMQDAVIAFLDANTDKWAAIAVISTFKNELTTTNLQIEDAMAIQEGNKVAIGQSSITINGLELSAGMYMYALIADGKEVATKRMILTD